MTRLSEERLEEILEQARGLRVAVVGDVMLDVYLSGNVGRISPEAPVPVVQVTEERVALGGAANVAANVAALGAHCELVGYVGKDAAGAELRRALSTHGARGIEARLIERADRPTTTKTRVMARKQQIVRFDREQESDLPEDCTDELCEIVGEVVERVDVLVLEDYNKGVLGPAVIRTALGAARVQGIPTVVDPKFRQFFAYVGATVFKPNVGELSAALGLPQHALDDRVLEDARRRLGCTHLLVTLGEDGMVVRSEGGSTMRVPAVAREVYDVSGAGDTVTACVALALAAGATIEEAAIFSNHAAAIEVGKPGVATVSPEELRLVVGGARLIDLAIPAD